MPQAASPGSRVRIATALLVVAGGARAQTTERVSVDSAGVEGDGLCKWCDVSGDGRYVAFDSIATNLVAGDGNGVNDVFLRDRIAGTTALVSVATHGGPGNGDSLYPACSVDGRYIAFSSEASDLVSGDLNGFEDIFVRDVVAGTTERVSVDSAGVEGDGKSTRPAISSDGRFVVWYSSAKNLVPGDTNRVADIYLRDRQSGTTERISLADSGAEPDGGCYTCSVADDGNVVTFVSDATNLVAGDTNGDRDVFVRDRAAGTTVRVSVSSNGAQGTVGRADSARISADGRFVVFYSSADNLVAGDGNRGGDIFVHDRQTATTELVSVSLTGGVGNDSSYHPGVSEDGRFVAFESFASDLVAADGNATYDVFVRDRQLGVTTRVSVDSAGIEGNSESHYHASIAIRGAFVSFSSLADNLVAGDLNTTTDIFVHHLCHPGEWSSYGLGWAGTLGIPTLVPRAAPVIGTTFDVDLFDSTGSGTFAVVLLGYSSVQLPTRLGGDLLVAPFLALPVNVPAGGLLLSTDLPNDEWLCGISFFAQALEIDLGATKKVSFTPGLEIIPGL